MQTKNQQLCLTCLSLFPVRFNARIQHIIYSDYPFCIEILDNELKIKTAYFITSKKTFNYLSKAMS